MGDRWIVIAVAALLGTACDLSSSDTEEMNNDAGRGGQMEMGTTPTDGGRPGDSAVPADSGPTLDMTALPADMATPGADMASPIRDAARPLEDAASPVNDAAPTAPDAARDSTPPPLDMALPVDMATPVDMTPIDMAAPSPDAAPPPMDAAPAPSPLLISDLESIDITAVPGLEAGFRCKAYVVCVPGQNCVYFGENLGYYASGERYYDGVVANPAAPARFRISVGAAGQCNDPPVAIEAGQWIRLTHDEGQITDVYLPAFEGPQLSLYIAVDGATYRDPGLTNLAQPAP